MFANYFFIDGSALTAQIRQLRKAKNEFVEQRLDPQKFIQYFMDHLVHLHEGSWKRAIFYFPQGDESAIADFLIMPDHRVPGEVRDMHFKFCGHKLKKSAEFEAFVSEHVPPKFHNRFSKSEKGIDIEICCDALRLASAARLERLFLLTNDSDFVPLCRTLKDFGANISIVHLSSATAPNHELLQASDSYDVIPNETLASVFLDAPGPEAPSENQPPLPGIDIAPITPRPEKPEAEPSDLAIAHDDPVGE